MKLKLTLTVYTCIQTLTCAVYLYYSISFFFELAFPLSVEPNPKDDFVTISHDWFFFFLPCRALIICTCLNIFNSFIATLRALTHKASAISENNESSLSFLNGICFLNEL